MYKDNFIKFLFLLKEYKFTIISTFILYILLFLYAIFFIINIPIAKIDDFEIKKNDYLLSTVKKIDTYNVLKPRTVILSYNLFLDEFKEGFYSFENKFVSLYDIFYKMNNNLYKFETILIPEGLTNLQIKNLLENEKNLVGEIINLPQEGFLYPSTYHFEIGDTRQDIVNKMMEEFDKKINNIWKKRNKNIPLNSIYEAFIIASMVEKETSVDAEKPLVASVFYNRINKKMRLQSDPTVIYGITNGKMSNIKILKSHLADKNPWNTYYIKGLPKTPISNFSLETLNAVLNPAVSDYYYFVAKPNNVKGHTFSKTLKEHNKNVMIWRKWKNETNK